MNYKTYLFDFDYTLADSSRGIVKCFRIVLTRHQYLTVTDEAIKRTIGKHWKNLSVFLPESPTRYNSKLSDRNTDWKPMYT